MWVEIHLQLKVPRNCCQEYSDGISSFKKYTWKLLLFSHQVMFDSLWPHRLQHARPPCLPLSPGVCSSSCPLNWWCYPIISSFLPSSPSAQSYQHQSLFQWVSSSYQVAKVLELSFSISPSNEYSGWFPLRLTSWISLQSKGLSGVFSNTTVQKHQFFCALPSSLSSSHICNDYWKDQRPCPWLYGHLKVRLPQLIK